MADSNAWGGPWTEVKVNVIRDYLQSYQIALKNTQFHRSYIDDGTWRQQDTSFGPLWEFEEEEKIAVELVRDGSALVAIGVEPPFDRYVFNDLNSDRIATLDQRAAERGLPKNSIETNSLDANQFIHDFCGRLNSKRERGVVLLDPWGMQLNWATIECVAKTQCLDMWYLFPTQSVVRMLPRSGLPQQNWCDKLDVCLGTREWRTEFYRPSFREADLFGTADEQLDRNVSFSNVEAFIVRQLRAEFKGGVLDNPLRLGPRNKPIFSFCFASSNPSEAAKRLANRLARGVIRANKAD
jgi:three-Cys-motif partner protein